MGLRIMQNAMAANAHRNMTRTDEALGRSMERLASGLRINRAGDDAAGLAKSEKLRADIRGIDQALRNVQDAVSFVQVGEGALDDVHAILQRINELAVAAANTASSDGTAEQAEVVELLKQLDTVGSTTTFAGMTIFGTSAATFQAGAEAGHAITMTTPALNSAAISDAQGAAVDLSTLDLVNDAANAIDLVRSAIGEITNLRAFFGAQQNRLEHTLGGLRMAGENLKASESRIRDLDLAAEMVTMTRHQIMAQAGTAMLAQANQAPRQLLSLISG